MSDNFKALVGHRLDNSALPTLLPQRLSSREASELTAALERYARIVKRPPEALPGAVPEWLLEPLPLVDPGAPGSWRWMASFNGPSGVSIDAHSRDAVALGAAIRWWQFVMDPVTADALRVVCRELGRALGAPLVALYAPERRALASMVASGLAFDQVVEALQEKVGPPVLTFAALRDNEMETGWSGCTYYIDDFSTWPDKDGPSSSR